MKIVRSVFAFGLLIAFASNGVAAEASGADSPECKEITARLIELTNAQFERVSPSGNNVFFKHPLVSEMSLDCSSHSLTGVFLGWEGAFPPNDWFAVAAKAGKAATGVEIKKLHSAIRTCHRAALKNKSELSELEIPNARIECQAFTRDGGGVSMSIWINDLEARKFYEGPK